MRSLEDVCTGTIRMPALRSCDGKCMIHTVRTAIALIQTLVIAALWIGGFDSAAAAPVPALGEPAATAPASGGPVIQPRGRAYLFRGAMGPIFSRGMDRLTERIEQTGITANVYEFTICRFIAATVIRDYRQEPKPIILIGHSMGGYCAIIIAQILQAQNIAVSLVVTIDPAHATSDVPLNVERFINIFLSESVLGGGDVKPLRGYQGHYASFDLSQLKEVTHINIDKMSSIHEQLVSKIVQLATTPAKTDDTVPLRYVVPPATAIELWDSGMPVFARPGDTLQTIAALYRVPLWSIAQMNKGAGNTPLVPGERIIVPRYLTPSSEASRPPPAIR
jgi:hypothetical protein